MTIRTLLLRYKSKPANFATSTYLTDRTTNNSYNHHNIQPLTNAKKKTASKHPNPHSTPSDPTPDHTAAKPPTHTAPNQLAGQRPADP
jgi:hypothetical protein